MTLEETINEERNGKKRPASEECLDSNEAKRAKSDNGNEHANEEMNAQENGNTRKRWRGVCVSVAACDM